MSDHSTDEAITIEAREALLGGWVREALLRSMARQHLLGRIMRIALENAVSVAGVLLLCEATMTEPPESAKREHEPIEP